MSEWQPIDTAPKVHGDKLLFWCAHSGLCGAEWVSEDLDLIGWDEPEWLITPVFDTDAWDSEWGEITHWMRPEPPTP